MTSATLAESRGTLRASIAIAAIALLHADATLQSRAIRESTIRAHMEFLASDAMKGRGSGTEDEWRTAVYIGSQLRRWGIEPLGDDDGFVQRIETGRSQATAPPTLSFEGTRLVHGREMLVQTIGRGSAAGPLFKYAPGVTIPTGAVVLLSNGVAPSAAMNAAAALLTAETAQLRATWDSTGARLPVGQTGRGGGTASAPARIALAWDAYGKVAALADGTSLTLTVESRPGYTWNAIGQLRGSDRVRSDEVILVSAHLDHVGVRGTGVDTIYNGADDDASGTTAVLALAEAIAGGKRPKRTVMFAWFGSEEAGGAGARHFLDSPPVPLDRIVANFEFEMIGRPDSVVAPKTLWLTGYERSNLGPELARRGARIVADPHPEQNFFTRSDNIQLACEGVVAQTISSFGLHKEYHQPSDDLAHIDFAHMTEAIASMLEPVLWLANSSFTPEWLPGKKPAPGNPCRR